MNQCREGFNQYRSWEKARELAYGALTCMGRHTLTGILTASGQQFVDWSAAYRLFSQQRIDTGRLFDVACKGVLEELDPDQAVIAHMDDTIAYKTGRHVPGTGWRRDPLGPPFHTNFIWGQRFIQISLALPDHNGLSQSRAIPVDFHHSPSAKKPSKSASKQQWERYKILQKTTRLSRQGRLRIEALRARLDHLKATDKQLIISVDGSYTNAEVLKSLPERTTLIGRIRKDTKLYTIPDENAAVGRKRIYGQRIPIPEQIRQSEEYPWENVKAWAAGKEHNFSVKVIKNLRWRVAGQKHNLQLVVIRPLGYRLSKKSRMLYRQPAYLICTDTELTIEKLLQAYLWRWEIEVNFREQKSLMGCGKAQVRSPKSVESIPAFITFVYALIHLAARKSSKKQNQPMLPRPKWYRKKPENRYTTGDLLNNIRAQIWALAIGINFSSFVNLEKRTQSLKNKSNPRKSAMFYLRN